MQKFETLRQPLLGFWIGVSRKEEKKKRKIPKIVATLVCSAGARNTLGPIVASYVYASSQGQRTHSARTKIIFRGGKGEGAVSSNPEGLHKKGLFSE